MENFDPDLYCAEIARDFYKSLGVYTELSSFSMVLLNGLSNYTYKVDVKSEFSIPEDIEPPFPIVVKIYKDYEGVNREIENKIIKEMSDMGRAPKVYFIDKDNKYRIEKFLKFEELKTQHLLDENCYSKIFEVMKDFVSIDLSKPLAEKKINLKCKDMLMKYHVVARKNFNKFLKDPEIVQTGKIESLFSKIDYYLENFDAILNQVFPDSLNSEDTLILTHNDSHKLNILVSKEKEDIQNNNQIKLIDFEFSNLSLFGIDIVNYLIESFFHYEKPEYPFYGLTKNIDEIKNDIYYDIYCKFVSYIFGNSGNNRVINNLKIEDVLDKKYYYRLICVMALNWFIIGLSVVDLKEWKEKTKFNYIDYCMNRLKFYEYAIVEFEKL